MVKKTVVQTKFSQLNDKQFYLSDGIVSVLCGDINLKEIDDFKKQKGQTIEKYFGEEKEAISRMGKKALKNIPKLYLYHQILMAQPKVFNKNNDVKNQNKTLLKRNAKGIILSVEWMK